MAQAGKQRPQKSKKKSRKRKAERKATIRKGGEDRKIGDEGERWVGQHSITCWDRSRAKKMDQGDR